MRNRSPLLYIQSFRQSGWCYLSTLAFLPPILWHIRTSMRSCENQVTRTIMDWVSMARCWHRSFLLMMACVCSWSITCCKSDEAAGGAFHGQKRSTEDIVARAIICFSDRYIYSGCQGQYRLGPEGELRVPAAAAGAFCGGPCLAETRLVLGCVDGIMDSFRFYNGASVRDVRLALDRGCGLRGDFDVLQRLGGDGDYGGGGRSSRRLPPASLLVSAVVALLLWG